MPNFLLLAIYLSKLKCITKTSSAFILSGGICDNFIIFPLIFCTNYLSLKIPSAILFSFATEWV